MPQELASLESASLLARLDAPRAGLTVLTPNHRLAQALARESDARQIASGATAWEAPDILHWGAWLQRCHEEATFSDSAAEVPGLLAAEESGILWEEAVAASRWRGALPSDAAIAALAVEAWTLAHAWGIEGSLVAYPGNEDAEAFNAWCAHYEKRTADERVTDAARLPARVTSWLEGGAVARPATLVLYAFDLLTPQQAKLFGECQRLGIEVLACAPPKVAGEVRRVELESPRREIECAARWARSRLERAVAEGRGAVRVAVIVPKLAERRAEVLRIFTRAFAGGEGAYFNLSAGEALADRPLVDAALALIDLALGALDYDRASRLLRSPFLDAAETERTGRARLDAALRRLAPARVSLRRLRALAGDTGTRRGAAQCPKLTELLDRLLEGAGDAGRATPQTWARRFSALLAAAGWPGERTLDSPEYQTLQKFRETLGALATLGSVAAPWDAHEARGRLSRLAGQTMFQPSSGDAPVQVLGILESAGLAFDHLWVSGLTEEEWPLAPRLHPLIPAALQRRSGMPQASAERSLEIDEALTAGWKTAADEVIVSNARADGDRLLLPSPLVAAIPETAESELAIPDYPTLATALFAEKGAISKRSDPNAPPLGTRDAPGGTSILADQAACPFRAFAHFRLDARALDRPEPGLGPPERGQLLHTMMAHLWTRLRDRATLEAIPPAELGAAIGEAAEHALKKLRADRPGAIEGRFAELERARLEKVAREWLAIELLRPNFEVVFREEKMTLSAGNLRLSGRADRIDRLEGGGLAVIDYKSGQARVGAWVGERPDDAQLPLYALAAEEEVHAVAFARLKVGELRFAGVARDEGILPNVKRPGDEPSTKKVANTWVELLAHWREQVAKLGENFAAGDAGVDPKHLLNTCERCDLKPLCRVHERIGALSEDEDAIDEEEAE